MDLGDGRGLAVDAARDLRAVRAAARRADLRIAFAADTHLHADFLSGAVQLAATDGSTVLASAAGGREFPHLGLADGDEVDLGGLRLRALATPGHTPEHVSSDRPIVVVRDRDQDPDEIVWQALKIGYEQLAGELAGGMPGWTAAGHPVTTVAFLAPPNCRAGRCSTSVRTASTRPATFPVPFTSSWATSPTRMPPSESRAVRWSSCAGTANAR